VTRLPSPAMLVALIALFVSLGGVSYGVATGSINSREIRNNTIRTQDIRNGQVRGRDVRNSTIRSSDIAVNAVTGVDVNETTLGPVPAASIGLSPVAHARVSLTGDVSEVSSRGVADGNVRQQIGTAQYCFGGLGFGFRTAQATIDYGDSSSDPRGRTAQVALGDPKGDCGPGNQLEVVTSTAAGEQPAGFYVWFFD
jgi:hypothetical protein